MIALKIASIGSFLAGLSHLTLQAYDHQSMPAYLTGFIVAGILQMLWAVIAWRGKLSPFWFWFGTLLNLGAVTFWLITRLMPAPFIGEKEHFSLIGYAVAVLEIVAVAGALVFKRNLLYWILVPFLGIGMAFAAYYAGIESEHHFPQFKVTGGHHHGGGHHTSKSNHHGNGMKKNMDHHQMKSDDRNQAEKHDNSDNHHAEKKEHDHADCDDGACPLEDSHSEPVDTETPEEKSSDKPTKTTDSGVTEPVVEVEAKVEVKTNIQVETDSHDDDHDEPHGH